MLWITSLLREGLRAAGVGEAKLQSACSLAKALQSRQLVRAELCRFVYVQ